MNLWISQKLFPAEKNNLFTSKIIAVLKWFFQLFNEMQFSCAIIILQELA